MTESRVHAEAHFHDDRAANIDVQTLDVERAMTAYTAVENRQALRYLGPVRDRRLLDIGCGYGEASVFFATQGAEVIGIDVSQGMLDIAARLARRYGVSPTFQNSALEDLPFPDAHFDLIYGFGVLHHADWRRAAQEIRRVLKPGGRAAIVEPLAYGPLVNVYRRMATRFRTPDERPFTRSELDEITGAFPRGHYEHCWILGQAVFCYMYLVERVHPNDAPYWKKVVSDGERYRAWLAPLLRADTALVKVPGLRWLAYSTVICLES